MDRSRHATPDYPDHPVQRGPQPRAGITIAGEKHLHVDTRLGPRLVAFDGELAKKRRWSYGSQRASKHSIMPSSSFTRAACRHSCVHGASRPLRTIMKCLY